MAATKLTLWNTLRYACKLLDTLFQYGSISTENFMEDYRALQTAYEGNNVNSIESALSNTRASLNTLMNQVGILTPVILELNRIGYGGISTTAIGALQEIRDAMALAGETVKSRAFTYGSIVTEAANLGTAQLFRLYIDKNGYNIEGGQYQSGAVECRIAADSFTGGQSLGRERAILRGVGTVGVDSLERGNCPSTIANIYATRNIDGLLNNPNLSYTKPSDYVINNWTLAEDAATHVNMVDDVLREDSNAIQFLNNNSMSQLIEDILTSDPTLPYFAIISVKKLSAGSDGNVILTLGSQSETVAVSTLSETDPTYIALGLEDEKGWYPNWRQSDAEFKIELASRTTGGIQIDNIILAQPTKFDSLYYLLVSGDTPSVTGDGFGITDSVSNTGRIQSTIARLFGEHLPSTSGTPTYADIT